MNETKDLITLADEASKVFQKQADEADEAMRATISPFWDSVTERATT